MMKGVFLVFFGLFAGCATIINDKISKINIASNKSKISGTIDGVPFHGPGVVNVTRSKEDKILKITTPGCKQKLALKSQVDSVFWVNILTGGPFGSTTDYATEEMWTYQDQIVVNCFK